MYGQCKSEILQLRALDDGYKQAEIARFLGFSETTISKIKRKMNVI